MTTYDPHTWVDNELITAALLNRMEQALAGALPQSDLDAILAALIGTGGTASATALTNDAAMKAAFAPNYGTVLLDSFPGANDDAKLAAAMTAVAADTYPRTIQLLNRQYTFATGNVTPYEGFRLRGPGGFSNPERNTASKSAFRIQLTMSGPWLYNPTTTAIFQVSLQNLVVRGNSTATLISSSDAGGTTGGFYCLNMRDIFTSGLKTVLGTQSEQLYLTAAYFDGAWEINNSYNGAFHIGGSDNSFNWTQCLLDSDPAFNSAGNASGQAHLWVDWLSKSYFGPMYITAEGPWRGIRVDGPSLNSGSTEDGAVQFTGLRLEGRNPSQPCDGALFKQTGACVSINGVWVGYGMNNPSVGELGVLQHNAGQLDVVGVTYDATNQTQNTSTSTPFLYTEGGVGQDVIVQRIKRASRGSIDWSTNRPLVVRNAGNAENRICDATVTQATV